MVSITRMSLVHIHGVAQAAAVQLVLKALDNQVHGGLDPGFGLAEVLPLHPGSLKLRVGVQQLLGSRRVVVQEGIDPVSLLRVLLHRPEDLGGDGLQPVDLGRESRVRDGVVSPADPPQDSGAALLRLLGGRRRGRLLLPALLFQVRVRLTAAEEYPSSMFRYASSPK